MGGGASNLSRTDLDIYQSSITDIAQRINNEASNLTDQRLDLKQTIKVTNGSDIPLVNPCYSRITQVDSCMTTECKKLNDPTIYQCQIKKGSYIGPTSEQNCNQAFGYTYEQSQVDEDGVCAGTVSPRQPRDTQFASCKNKILRNYCIPNTPGQFIEYTKRYTSPTSDGEDIPCTTDIDCPINNTCDTEKNICGIKSLPGSTQENCGGNCGGHVIYLVEQITPEGNRKFSQVTPGVFPQLGVVNHCAIYTPQNPGDTCYSIINTDDYFGCSEVIGSGGTYKGNEQGYQDAFAKCANTCKITYSCTPEEIKLFTPPSPTLVAIGGMCLSNSSNSSFISDQTTEATTTATMVSYISNDFQSTISKTISQTNKGINFGQENNSMERSSVTQKIKNTITQAINTQSKNYTSQISNNQQIIEFKNTGTTVVTGGDRDCKVVLSENPNVNCVQSKETPDPSQPSECGNASFVISNKAVNELNSTQKASSIVDALMNSSVLNTLSSKYDYKLSQKNENDILGALAALLGLIILGAIIVGVALQKTIQTVMKWAVIALIVVIVLYFIATLIYFGSQHVPYVPDAISMGIKKTPVYDKNPSGSTETTAPTSSPTNDPNNPGPDEIKCEIGNFAGCSCNVFIKTQDKSETNKQKLCDFTKYLETNKNDSLDTQCNTLLNRNITWGELSGDAFAKTCKSGSCPNRNFVSTGNVRAVCK